MRSNITISTNATKANTSHRVWVRRREIDRAKVKAQALLFSYLKRLFASPKVHNFHSIENSKNVVVVVTRSSYHHHFECTAVAYIPQHIVDISAASIYCFLQCHFSFIFTQLAIFTNTLTKSNLTRLYVRVVRVRIGSDLSQRYWKRLALKTGHNTSLAPIIVVEI